MNVFEQQEMSKSRSVLTSKLNDWYDWLINHVPSAIKDGASRGFKAFKDKIMGFYNRVTGNQTQHKIDGTHKPEPQRPQIEFRELEQEFGRVYRSYRVMGIPRTDPDTFFNLIRNEHIKLIAKELRELRSARVQTTTWIRFRQDFSCAELAFNSRMIEFHEGTDIDMLVDTMINHMRGQIENPALINSRFLFEEVLFMDVNFHRLNLTRGGTHLPLPKFIESKRAVINPQNQDNEYFKWAVLADLHNLEIKFNPERLSKLRKFESIYDWSDITYPTSLKDISKFEFSNY